MDRFINQLHFLREGLETIQRRLDFEEYKDEEIYPQYATRQGLGRVALLAFGLGSIGGIHFTLWILLSLVGSFDANSEDDSGSFVTPQRQTMIWQWCFYITAMCIFHLLEFFVTSIYNPYETNSNSFLVNHSRAYTAAALIAGSEFWIKFVLFGHSQPSVWMIRIGVIGVFSSQIIRSVAMKTCGESFNHLIQTSKKDNHVLIQTGIYSRLRHPSYVGFYYWSISTQLVLGNYFSTLLFAVAAWMFFKRRIPYEEESLVEHFPNEYPDYAKQTWVGIPFIPNHIEAFVKEMNTYTDNKQDDGGQGVEIEVEHEKQS